MITQSKFENGITLLQTHFNRKLCPEAIAIWSEYLNEYLDDETFTLAVKQAILSLDFFPNAKRLVEFATADNEAKAIRDWQVIIAAAKTSNEEWRREILNRLPRCARMALEIIGGVQAVAIAEERLLNKLEKQFHTVYCQPSLETNLLPPARSQSNAFVVEPENDEPIDLSTKPPSIQRILQNLSLRSMGEQIPVEQVYKNTFARYGYEIDDNRLSYFLKLEQKREVLNKFSFAVKNKSAWRSPVSIFDEITGYQSSSSQQIDSKAIARQWLEGKDHE